MSRGEDLVRDFEEKVVYMAICFQSPEYTKAVIEAKKAREALLGYIKFLQEH